MKHIGVGILWSFTLMWAGNYLALAFGVSPILTAGLAVAAGVAIAVRPFAGTWTVAKAPAGTRQATPASTEALARS